LGAGTGGSLGDNHWVDDLHIETVTAPATDPAHPLVITNSPTGGGVPAEPLVHLEIKDFTTQVNTNTVKNLSLKWVTSLTTGCGPTGRAPAPAGGGGFGGGRGGGGGGGRGGPRSRGPSLDTYWGGQLVAPSF
jgi:hypothetical protein